MPNFVGDSYHYLSVLSSLLFTIPLIFHAPFISHFLPSIRWMTILTHARWFNVSFTCHMGSSRVIHPSSGFSSAWGQAVAGWIVLAAPCSSRALCPFLVGVLPRAGGRQLARAVVLEEALPRSPPEDGAMGLALIVAVQRPAPFPRCAHTDVACTAGVRSAAPLAACAMGRYGCVAGRGSRL